LSRNDLSTRADWVVCRARHERGGAGVRRVFLAAKYK
jgi:hypothetical protein